MDVWEDLDVFWYHFVTFLSNINAIIYKDISASILVLRQSGSKYQHSIQHHCLSEGPKKPLF